MVRENGQGVVPGELAATGCSGTAPSPSCEMSFTLPCTISLACPILGRTQTDALVAQQTPGWGSLPPRNVTTSTEPPPPRRAGPGEMMIASGPSASGSDIPDLVVPETLNSLSVNSEM